MKKLLLTLSLALMSFGFVAVDDAQARSKRLGGGSSSGMTRQAPPPQQAPTQAAPAKQATAPAANSAAAAPAAAPKRSWMGPIAGLAAGLGLAALMSHLGLGDEFANFLMLALLAVVAIVAVRFLLRRFGPAANAQAAPQGLRFAGAAPAAERPLGYPTNFGAGSAGAAVASTTPLAAAPSGLPADFDAAAFERVAKLVFIRMQAANDAGNLDDLRQFSTPEMFATFKLDLQDRGAAAQKTDVVQLDAQVVDFAEEAGRQIVSVRFHGLLREEQDAGATPFDEVWHLVKPVHGDGPWAIAGIAQHA